VVNRSAGGSRLNIFHELRDASYISAAEAQNFIAERRRNLIHAASEPRVVRPEGEPVAGAKLRRPFRPTRSKGEKA
jgi:hypothetical protein